MKWRLLPVVAMVLLMAGGAFLSACGSRSQTPATARTVQAEDLPDLSAVPLDEENRLRVVATTNIVADVVANVGGDSIELKTLLPAGTDPHTYQPTPQDLRAVTNAHAIFANGAGLEAFLDEMIQNAGGDAPVIPVSHGVALLALPAEEEEHGDGEVDPHTWFDPNNVVIWVRNIERALRALDPANAEMYGANAEAYTEELKALDAWIREQVAQVPAERRKIVTDHRVFDYLAEEYGFEVIGAVVETFSTAAEPSAQELVTLEDKISKYGVPAIFVGRTVNPRLAARVAEDTGIKLVPLYTGSLSEPGGEADSYIEFMRYDVSAIVQALRQRN